MLGKLKAAMAEVDRDMVRRWVEDLVIVKTYMGLRFQEAILAEVATHRGQKYRLATAAEESRGIDGYVGSTPVSIKPATYKGMEMIDDTIRCEIIYYEKRRDGILVETDEEL